MCLSITPQELTLVIGLTLLVCGSLVLVQFYLANHFNRLTEKDIEQFDSEMQRFYNNES